MIHYECEACGRQYRAIDVHHCPEDAPPPPLGAGALLAWFMAILALVAWWLWRQS